VLARVSLVDPTSGDLTIVIETAGSASGPFCDGNCNGHCRYGQANSAQNATFRLSAATPGMEVPNTLVQWRTQLGPGAVPESSWFERVGTLPVDSNGMVTVSLEPDVVVTLTTSSKGQKGSPQIPDTAPFPLPYTTGFEGVDPPQQAPLWSDMEGAFEVATDPHNSDNQVLRQAAPRQSCCNFIPSLDGPVPLTIIGSSAFQDVEATVLVNVAVAKANQLHGAEAAWGAVGIRAHFTAGSFFNGGLGMPTGLFLAVNSAAWALLLQPPYSGLPSVCAAPICIAKGAVDSTVAWHSLRLGVANRTVVFTVDGREQQPVTLPATVDLGTGYISLASSWSEVLFDNVTIKSLGQGRCAPPAAGDKLVSIGCGEAAAAAGSNFDVGAVDRGAPGPISLRRAPGLCLEIGPSSAETIPRRGGAPTSNGEWNASILAHGSAVSLSADSLFATWPRGMGHPGCDSVALVNADAALDALSTSTWYHVVANEGHFIDVGWCLPSIDVSGSTWMGWQPGKCWVYRGLNGAFKIANGTQDQGAAYGPTFGLGANVTAIMHSPVSVEFLLDGRSLGVVGLPADHAIPPEAVPCAGGCDGVVLGLAPGGPPPPPPPTPPTPPTEIRLAKCAAGKPEQQWAYDATLGKITSATGRGALSAAWSSGFAPATLTPEGSQLWWSPDLAMGQIHGRSNAPMNCECLAVCGVLSL